MNRPTRPRARGDSSNETPARRRACPRDDRATGLTTDPRTKSAPPPSELNQDRRGRFWDAASCIFEQPQARSPSG